MLKLPKCPICGDHPLQLAGDKWMCNRTGFYFNVIRGVAGAPLLSPPRQRGAELPVVAGSEPTSKQAEDTFGEWLAKRGVTPEMYKDLVNLGPAGLKMKDDLRTAFYQRDRKDADVVLLPPQ